MIGLEIFKKYLGELNEFIDSDEFKNSEHVPISVNRVKSFINNPKGTETKPILYLGYSGDKLIVYRTVLQDGLSHDGKSVEIAWLSGVWTHPSFRRKGLANTLLNEVYQDYEGKLIVTNFGVDSGKLFEKNPLFKEFKRLPGHRFYFRLSLSEILPPKSRFFKKIKFILTLIDKIANPFLELRYIFKKKYRNSFISTSIFDDELQEYLAHQSGKSLFKRRNEDFKWIVDYPWILQKTDDNEHDKKYHFTTTAKRFYTKTFTFKENGMISGFLLFTVKNDAMKIHYLYADSNLVFSAWSEFILDFILREKIGYLLTVNRELINILKNKDGFLFSKQWDKRFFCGKELLEKHPEVCNLNLEMGDGDSIFT